MPAKVHSAAKIGPTRNHYLLLPLFMLSFGVGTSSSLWAKRPWICKGVKPASSSSFKKILRDIKGEIGRMATQAPIKTNIEQTLQRLIKAKDPALMNWIKANRSQGLSQKQILTDWKNHYFKNHILKNFANNSQAINWQIHEAFNYLNYSVFDSVTRAYFDRIFSFTKDLLLYKLKTRPWSRENWAELSARIKASRLYWISDFRNSKLSGSPMDFLDWNLRYDPQFNNLNVGPQIFKYDREESLVSVMAHHLAHAFDPCRWGAYFKSENPFWQLEVCLRSSSPYPHAHRRNDAKLLSMTQSRQISRQFMDVLKSNPACNTPQYPPRSIQRDQINEVFADWISAEVLSVYPNLSRQFRTDLCKKKKMTRGSDRLSPSRRLKRIYLAHPTIRRRLRLKPTENYCQWELIGSHLKQPDNFYSRFSPKNQLR